MRIGMIGLGRMGYNLAARLLRGGHEVVAWNRTAEVTRKLAAEEGAIVAEGLAELVRALPGPRTIWVMLPAGKVTESVIDTILPLLDKGDILIDGGNTYYKDDLRRAERARGFGVRYTDMGVSGGIHGLAEGFCIMVGGHREVYDHLTPALDSLTEAGGHLYCGPVGSGHFVKMVHNGIEYGMMQAYAEGFAIIQSGPYTGCVDYASLSRLWNTGSVIRSWLLELSADAFAENADLSGIEPTVDDSGEGRWTVQQAVESGASAPVITLALMERFRSREKNSFADRYLAVLRNQFGGHKVHRGNE